MRAFVIDAFTDVAFRGNPAGVVILDAPAESNWMQSVAAELKHSETAFVRVRADGDHDLRWFTPAVEVDLCGHATLATTHALTADGGGDAFVFHTRSGVLRTTVADARIAMDFPAQLPRPLAAGRARSRARGAAGLRARQRHRRPGRTGRRGPGHGLRALHAHAVLVGPAGEVPD